MDNISSPCGDPSHTQYNPDVERLARQNCSAPKLTVPRRDGTYYAIHQRGFCDTHSASPSPVLQVPPESRLQQQLNEKSFLPIDKMARRAAPRGHSLPIHADQLERMEARPVAIRTRHFESSAAVGAAGRDSSLPKPAERTERMEARPMAMRSQRPQTQAMSLARVSAFNSANTAEIKRVAAKEPALTLPQHLPHTNARGGAAVSLLSTLSPKRTKA